MRGREMEQNIQAVIVMVKRLKVSSFSTSDNTVSISVLLNDSKDRELNWKSRISEPKLMSAKMLTELMALEEGECAEFDGETLTTATVVLYEKARTEAALADFFQTIYSKTRRIKNARSSDGFLNLVSDLQRTELVL